MELKSKIHNYEWGKRGTASLVATLHKNVNSDFKIEETKPYAELWMGTHVNGPSVIKSTGELLSSYLSKNTQELGEKARTLFNNELPFLFKVLSVNNVLSIQAHPSKQHAEELNRKYPDIYKDPNHKPELAIALTNFEVLCGFRPITEIRAFMSDLQELRDIVDDCYLIDDNVEFLKSTFRSVLTCKKSILISSIDSLLKKFSTIDEKKRKIYLADLVQRLHQQFPYDNGILMVYFLNYLQLKPTEAIYLGPNEPHAYISGDCIENMACSDNVVRAGLTPKLVDVETLCSMLKYEGEEGCNKLFQPIIEDNFTKLYQPPVVDFAVAGIKIPTATTKYEITPRKSASIIIVITGYAKYHEGEVKPGVILFIPANKTLQISNITEEVSIYQAFANIF